MLETNYSYYDINSSDIWRYEQQVIAKSNGVKEFHAQLLVLIKQLVINNCKPTYTIDYSEVEDKVRYYKSRYKKYSESLSNLQKQYQIDFFFAHDDCYQFGHSIIIDRNTEEFDFWFALKLRQYDGKVIAIADFLNYQLNQNFQGNNEAFSDFLKLSIRQYQEELFTQRVIDTVQEWMGNVADTAKAEIEKKPEEENISKPPKKKKKNKITIGIHPDFQEPVIKALLPFFDEKEHELLTKLVKGREIQGKIYFQSNANRLVMVMRQLHLHQKMVGKYVETEEWICHYFQYYNFKKKNRSDFATSDVHKILTDRSYDMPKEKRIEIPNLDFIKEKSKEI